MWAMGVGSANTIYLIDENDGGSGLFRLLEQDLDSACSDTDDHLNEQGGQQQRVAVAPALVTQPSILSARLGRLEVHFPDRV